MYNEEFNQKFTLQNYYQEKMKAYELLIDLFHKKEIFCGGATYRNIAEEFGMSHSYLHDVINKKKMPNNKIMAKIILKL